MPTERFYHLSEEKKKLIKEAAIKEFCRAPLEKASINKIVQNAAISRGSFYTYFSDKEDILEYIFEDLVLQVQGFCKATLVNAKGDFWELPGRLLDYVLEVCESSGMFSMMQSAMGNQVIGKLMDRKLMDRKLCAVPFYYSAALSGEKKAFSQAGGEDVQAASGDDGIDFWLSELYQLTDGSKLRKSGFEDFWLMFSLCIMNMMMTIGEIYQKGIEEKEAKTLFAKRLEIIKQGAARE